jgi:hypothetical protein
MYIYIYIYQTSLTIYLPLPTFKYNCYSSATFGAQIIVFRFICGLLSVRKIVMLYCPRIISNEHKIIRRIIISKIRITTNIISLTRVKKHNNEYM